MTVRLLLDAMIQHSDNAATDMLIRHVGLAAVNRALTKEGIFGFGPITTLLDVRRLVYREIDPRTSRFTPRDIFILGMAKTLEERMEKLAELIDEPPGTFTPAHYSQAFHRYYAEGHNTASVESMGELLERIALGKVISPRRSKEMIDIMLGTRTGSRRIRAGLPRDMRVAHKTGTQYRRIADFSVIYLGERRPIVFAVALKSSRSKKKSEEVIAQIVRRTTWHLTPPGRRSALTSPRLVEPELDPEEIDLLHPDAERRQRRRRRPPRKKPTPTSTLPPAPPTPEE